MNHCGQAEYYCSVLAFNEMFLFCFYLRGLSTSMSLTNWHFWSSPSHVTLRHYFLQPSAYIIH